MLILINSLYLHCFKLFDMKNLIILLLGSVLLSSCYAFLQADKLVYAGSLVKNPKTIKVDSVYTVE